MFDESTIPTTAERLRHLATIGRRRWPVLVLVTLLAAATAWIVAAGGAKHYEATSKLVLTDSSVIDVPAGTGTTPNTDPERDLNTKIGLIRVEPVARQVARRLGLHTSLPGLLKQVAATPEGTTNIVDITATDRGPARARDLANAFASEYVRFRSLVAISSLRQATDGLQEQLAQLPASERGSGVEATLRARLRDLTAAAAVQTGGAEVVERATTPLHPAAPTPLKTGILGGLAGLMLALAIVAFIELRNRRVTEEDAKSIALGSVVLAAIPRSVSRLSLRGREATDRLQTRGYDRLAGQLQLAARRVGARTLLVTSPGRGDGKSSVTLRLAQTLAMLGNRVVIVQADVHEELGAATAAPGHGLTGVVLASSTVAAELVDLDVLTLAPTNAPTHVHGGSIAVLPAGVTGQAQRLSSRLEIGEDMRQSLGRPELTAAINECRSIADFVLIDAPAIDGLHAAPALIDAVDASLLVVRVGWTPRQAVTEGVHTLEGLGARPLGLVMTGARRGDPDPQPTRRAEDGQTELAAAGTVPTAADLSSYRRGRHA